MYFHVSPAAHEAGTILEPGRHGDFIRRFQYGVYASDADTFSLVMREMLLETARVAVASDAPSRLNCVFVASTIEFARMFRDGYRHGASILSVEPQGAPLAPRACSFSLISTPKNGTPSYISYMPTEAVQYWTTPAPEGDLIELLYPGPLRVIGIAE
ncbi:hypothetical protein QYR00_05830 [Agrobacterium tumefaciens]|nr:hypothetical protein QYR00_05830 [Agrobacterium tumefaciens]